MNHTEVIKAVMKETKTRQIDLVAQLGVKSQTVISERINQKNISVRTLLEMLDTMGYKLVVRKLDDENPSEEYSIQLSDYEI